MIFKIKFDGEMEAEDLNDVFYQIGHYFMKLAEGNTDIPSFLSLGYTSIKPKKEKRADGS